MFNLSPDQSPTINYIVVKCDNASLCYCVSLQTQVSKHKMVWESVHSEGEFRDIVTFIVCQKL